jgi:formylglycine-generating enzyme required for sulfatase activity
MSDKKTNEPKFISAKDSEEWSQVFHGEMAAEPDNDTHKEAEVLRNYLIAKDEARALDNLPEVDLLTTMSPDDARVIYQNASKEIQRRGTSWKTRLKAYAVPVALGGLSAAVVFLLMKDSLLTNNEPESKQVASQNDNPSVKVVPLNGDGYEILATGATLTKYPNMLLMSGGRMKMGCTKGWDDASGGCRSSEFPAHNVDLQPFEISQHEVTVGQFEHFVEATKYQTDAEVESRGCVYQDLDKPGDPFLMKPEYNWRNPGFEQDESHPVTCISWSDTQAYLTWLNQETDGQYRLPSEAEWEFAARGGKSTEFFWGTAGALHLSANHNNEKDGWAYTATVGSFPANEYSVQDTSGNVWEWVQDCWHDSYDGAPTDGSAWVTGCKASNSKTRRGGGWDGDAPGIRSAVRSSGAVNDRSNLYGFRIAQDYLKNK